MIYNVYIHQVSSYASDHLSRSSQSLYFFPLHKHAWYPGRSTHGVAEVGRKPRLTSWMATSLTDTISVHFPSHFTLQSSTKPEVYNILYYRQKRTEPVLPVTCTENNVKFGHVIFEICELTQRQTNKQADKQMQRWWSQYFAPYWAWSKEGSIKPISVCSYIHCV